jgi:hypothetical protein
MYMSEHPLEKMIRPYVSAISFDAKNGMEKAKMVITLYQMVVRAPNDPGSHGLCEAAFKEWMDGRQ